MTESNFGYGQQGPASSASPFATVQFHIDQVLTRVRVMIPVKVVDVHGDGDSTSMTVDVQPLVNQTDGQGNAVAHGTIYGVPVSMPQGGDSLIVLPVAKGDIGEMAVADRDISAVKANKGIANPGSHRSFDLADGVYRPAMYSGTPTAQKIKFTSDGIQISDKNGNEIKMTSGMISMTATMVEINGKAKITGDLQLGGALKSVADGVYTDDLQTSGNVVAGQGTGDRVGLQSHTHESSPAGDQTSAPTAGT